MVTHNPLNTWMKKTHANPYSLLAQANRLAEADLPEPPEQTGEPPVTASERDELPPPPAARGGEKRGNDRYAKLKDLARKDLPTLKHLMALKKMYAEDGDLSSKTAQLSIQSVLTRLFRYNEQAALQFGRISWDPDMISWVGFFDDAAGERLGAYLGIDSMEAVPRTSIEGAASPAELDHADFEGEVNGSEPEQEEPEVPGLDDAGAPAPDPAIKGPARPSESVIRRNGDGLAIYEGKRLVATFAMSDRRLFEKISSVCKRRNIDAGDQLDHGAKLIRL